MKEIFKSLLAAHKPEQVREVIMIIGKAKYRFEPVGNRKNNLATINIGTDPAAGVTERITNAIDAVLEKEWIDQEEPTDIKTPRRASELWFNIEQGKISKISDSNDERLRSLSPKVKVTLTDSGQKTKPTVEIRDLGIGLEPEQFSKTILDLNGNNKIGKLHLMGAYGQGGSTALSYNNLTLIISRPFFGDKRKKPKVAWTIVRINPGDVNKDKHEWYEYMVDKGTGQPFVTEIDDKEFEPGTLVRHIMMDLGKFKGNMTAPGTGLWYLAHNYLFDPIIPFTISDERGSKPVNRTVTGNNRLLTNTDFLDYPQEVPLTFKDGKVIIYYWVLNTTGDNPKTRIKNYVMPSQPIVITFNGQKQGVIGNTLIKNDLKLPFLDNYLIVQIEADNMDNDSKRQLFSSTRESLRDTSILEELKKLTLDTLAADDELKRLDRERKQRYFTQEDTSALDNLRKRLARRINTFLKSSGSGNSVTATKTNESHNSEKLPEIPVEDPPTFFEIVTPSPKEVYQNKSFAIKFKTDAHPSYFNKAETFVAFIEPQSFGMFTGTARVVDGYGLAHFRVSEETQIGDEGQITLELRPPRQKSFNSAVDIVAIERPEDSNPSGDGDNKTPNIQVEFVDRNNPWFQENEWNDLSVAQVLDDQDGVIIYVSAENKNLTKLVARAQRYSEEAVDSIQNKYLEHISFYAFMANKVEPSKLFSEGQESLQGEFVEKLRDEYMKNVSETVCGMINDFFEPIITETVENDSVMT